MKKFILILMPLLMLLFLPVYAEEHDWEYIDGSADIVVTVIWENETPDVVLIDPTGLEYNLIDENESYDGKILFYIIESPKAGYWKVDLDKKDNQVIEIGMQKYFENPIVRDLSIGGVYNTTLPVNFNILNKDDITVDYKISAVTEVNGIEKELASGYTNTNTPFSMDVDLSGLATHDHYLIKVDALFTIDGIDYFDYAYSQPFKWFNSEKSSMDDFEMTVDESDYSVTLAWPNIDYGAEQVLVAIFEDKSEEPTTFFNYGKNETAKLAYFPETEDIRVEVSVMKSGVYVSTLSKSVDLKRSGIQLEDFNTTNKTSIKLNYENLKSVDVSIDLNGQSAIKNFNGSGSYSLMLQEFTNTITLDYLENGIHRKITKEVFVDRIPPQLTVEYSDHIVEKMTKVVGFVKDANRLLLNGEVIEFDQAGLFTFESPKQESFELIAIDLAGNEVKYVYTYEEESIEDSLDQDPFAPIEKWDILSKITSKHILYIALGICLMILVYGFMFWKKDEEGNDEKSNK